MVNHIYGKILCNFAQTNQLGNGEKDNKHGQLGR